MHRAHGWSPLKVVSVLIGLLVLGEAVSYFALDRFARDRLEYHWRINPAARVADLTDADIRLFRDQFFDRDLGWVFHSNTKVVYNKKLNKDGARVNPWPAKKIEILAYGDHYTFGQDTPPDETWPYFLSALTNSDVRNFGVMLYSPVQSLMRLRRHLNQGHKPKAVVLAMASDSLAPMMGSHRFAYRNDNPGIDITSIATYFAPTIIASESGAKLVPGPLQAARKLTDFVAALQKSGPTDYWYQYDQTRPQIGFPYSWSALDTTHYLAFRVQRWEQFWTMREATARLRGVVDIFMTLSKLHEFIPVFAMLPKGLDLRRLERNEAATYRVFIDKLEEDYGNRLITIDLLKGPLTPNKLHKEPYIGVLSAYGNELLAKAISKKLNDVQSAAN